MVNYDLKALQNRLKDILRDIDATCRRHHLRYYILDGSTLGAVRHSGFIPWDDDMDIGMPREDYDTLIAHCKEWLPEHLELVSYETDKNYPLPFAKIQDARTTLIERPHLYYLGGAFVDVFPIDGAPEGKWRQWWFERKYKILYRLIYLRYRDPYRRGRGPSSWASLLVQKLFSKDTLQKAVRRHMTTYPFATSRTVQVNHNDGRKSMVSREEVLGEPTPISFDGEEFMALKDNDAYLRQLFGDYMQLPPEDQRKQHGFYYLDLDHPYREYNYEGEKVRG